MLQLRENVALQMSVSKFDKGISRVQNFAEAINFHESRGSVLRKYSRNEFAKEE